MFADLTKYARFRESLSDCALVRNRHCCTIEYRWDTNMGLFLWQSVQQLNMDFSDDIEANLTLSGMNGGFRRA
jgi:hypothetical protein